MRQFVPKILVLASILALITAFTACGGGTPKANVVDSVAVTPTVVSLNKGDIFSLTSRAFDKSGNAVAAQFTFTSSNSNLASVAPDGTICAGTWDSKFIDCTPATGTGTATITVSAGGRSTTSTVYVHEKVDSVLVTPPADCVSSADTLQLTAKAYSNDAQTCQRLNAGAPPCEIPASTIGNFVWATNDSYVVTIDNTATNSGLATAVNPGQTSVFASLSNNNSPAVKFTACPVASLSISVKDATADPFSIDKGSTKNLVATAVDSKGKTLDTVPLTWTTSQSFAMSVAGGANSAPTATATASSPGTTGIVATCTPPACNRNLSPVFSNLIVGTTNGTSPGDMLYVASKDSTSLVPVDLANSNTVGTTVALPHKPNSFVISRNGLKIAIGSDPSSMIFDPLTSTVTPVSLAGKMLGFSQDSSKLAFAASDSELTLIVDTSNLSTLQGLSFTGDINKLHIDFTPDANYAFMTTAAGSMQTWDISGTTQTLNLSAPANDLNFMANGWAAYLAGGAANQITARAACNPFDTGIDSKAASDPQIVRAIPDGSGMLVLDPPNMVELSPINVTNPAVNPTAFTQCPPVINSTRNSYLVGITTPTAMIVTPDSSKAFITDGSGTVYIFDVAGHTTKPVTLAGTVTETYQADVTLDSRYAFVGANDGKVHKIDLIAGSDVAQIDPGIKQDDKTTPAMPHFLGLRHK